MHFPIEDLRIVPRPAPPNISHVVGHVEAVDAPVSPTSISKRQQGLPPLVEFVRTEPEREAYTSPLRRVVRGVPSKEDILIVPIQIQSLSQLPLSKFRRVLARSVPAIPTGILEISVKGPMPD